MPLIELQDITRAVPIPDEDDLHILRGINLRVDAEERVSIVGRSGTGKTTLLNIIGMLDLPDSGTYHVNGRDVLALGEGRRAAMRGNTVGFVFQQFNIFNTRTALENVAVPLLYERGLRFWRRNQIAAEMLDRVGLGDRLHSSPAQMSGGEQQRIAIARALIREPQIILADEPTGALDPDTGRTVIELLQKVAAENSAALIIITHDMDIARGADSRYELAEGVLHPLEGDR
ncbi:MAG: ABC transporter ATP-binding protein [Actinomycetaceae bacterium]|nr:ABC transporter ATP-binding protein [Actinomycetaceae bacterium]